MKANLKHCKSNAQRRQRTRDYARGNIAAGERRCIAAMATNRMQTYIDGLAGAEKREVTGEELL